MSEVGGSEMEKAEEVDGLNDVKYDASTNVSPENCDIEKLSVTRPKTREEEIEDNLQLQIQQAIEDSIINRGSKQNTDRGEGFNIANETLENVALNSEIDNSTSNFDSNINNTNSETIERISQQNLDEETTECVAEDLTREKIESLRNESGSSKSDTSDIIGNIELNQNSEDTPSNEKSLLVTVKEGISNEDAGDVKELLENCIGDEAETLQNCTENESAKTAEIQIDDDTTSSEHNNENKEIKVIDIQECTELERNKTVIEEIEMVNKEAPTESGNTNKHKEIERVDIQESTELENKNEDIETEDAQESTEVQNKDEDIEIVDTPESEELQNKDEDIEIVDTPESVELQNKDEDTEIVDIQESTELKDKNEVIEFVDLQESSELENENKESETMDIQESIESENRNQYEEIKTCNNPESVEDKSKDETMEVVDIEKFLALDNKKENKQLETKIIEPDVSTNNEVQLIDINEDDAVEPMEVQELIDTDLPDCGNKQPQNEISPEAIDNSLSISDQEKQTKNIEKEIPKIADQPEPIELDNNQEEVTELEAKNNEACDSKIDKNQLKNETDVRTEEIEILDSDEEDQLKCSSDVRDGYEAIITTNVYNEQSKSDTEILDDDDDDNSKSQSESDAQDEDVEMFDSNIDKKQFENDTDDDIEILDSNIEKNQSERVTNIDKEHLENDAEVIDDDIENLDSNIDKNQSENVTKIDKKQLENDAEVIDDDIEILDSNIEKNQSENVTSIDKEQLENDAEVIDDDVEILDSNIEQNQSGSVTNIDKKHLENDAKIIDDDTEDLDFNVDKNQSENVTKIDNKQLENDAEVIDDDIEIVDSNIEKNRSENVTHTDKKQLENDAEVIDDDIEIVDSNIEKNRSENVTHTDKKQLENDAEVIDDGIENLDSNIEKNQLENVTNIDKKQLENDAEVIDDGIDILDSNVEKIQSENVTNINKKQLENNTEVVDDDIEILDSNIKKSQLENVTEPRDADNEILDSNSVKNQLETLDSNFDKESKPKSDPVGRDGDIQIPGSNIDKEPTKDGSELKDGDIEISNSDINQGQSKSDPEIIDGNAVADSKINKDNSKDNTDIDGGIEILDDDDDNDKSQPKSNTEVRDGDIQIPDSILNKEQSKNDAELKDGDIEISGSDSSQDQSKTDSKITDENSVACDSRVNRDDSKDGDRDGDIEILEDDDDNDHIAESKSNTQKKNINKGQSKDNNDFVGDNLEVQKSKDISVADKEHIKDKKENEDTEKNQRLNTATSTTAKARTEDQTVKRIIQALQSGGAVSVEKSKHSSSNSNTIDAAGKPGQAVQIMKVANRDMVPKASQREISIREVDRSNNLYEVVAVNDSDSIEIIDDDDDEEIQDEEGDMQYITANNTGKTKSHNLQQLMNKVVADASDDYAALPLECIITEKPERPVSQNIVNHNIPSEWLRSYLEETSDPDYMISKQEIYSDYCYFCEQNGIQPFALTMFGKLMKQLFPNLQQRRIRTRGISMYCYVGLRKCYDHPHFPKFAANKPKPQPQPQQKPQPRNEVVRNVEVEMGENDDNYRSGQLDGKTILVHDPLSLLSLSTKDEIGKRGSTSKNYAHRLFEKTEKPLPTIQPKPEPRPINRNPPFQIIKNRLMKSVSVKSTTQRPSLMPNIFKVKYKQYKHPSIQKVCKTYNSIILPSEILSLNINPRIALNSREVYNWYAKQIQSRAKKLLCTNITKSNDGINKITCRCCTDTLEINSNCAHQLNTLKDNLLDFIIRKSNDNLSYEVVRLRRSRPPPPPPTPPPIELPIDDTPPIPIVKRLKLSSNIIESHKQLQSVKKSRTSQSQSHDHTSIQKLRKTYKHLNIPKEICKTDVNPFVLVNSGEVLAWYTYQMNNLKNKLLDVEDIINDVIVNEKNAHSSRRSKAKLMNFCEIDSSDYETDKEERRLSNRRKSVTSVSKSSSNLDILSESIHKNNFEKLTQLLKSVKATIRSPRIGQKRPLTIDAEMNEFEQKRKKFFSNRIQNLQQSRADLASVRSTVIASSSEEQRGLLQYNHLEVREKIVDGIICVVCGNEYPNEKIGDHSKKHLKCKHCKTKLKNVESVMQHFARHCILNNSNNQPGLKLQRIDSIEEIVKKYPDAFNIEHTIPNVEGRRIICRPTSMTSKPNSKFSVKNVFVSRSSNENSNAISIITPQGKCIRTYSKKIPISPASGRVVNVSPENETSPTQPPVLQLKNTINSNLNKILVLSNNVSSSPSNVVYGRVLVSSVGGQSSTTNTFQNSFISNLNLNACRNTSVQQSSQIVESNILGDHSYHQPQQAVIQIANSGLNQIVIIPGSTVSSDITSVNQESVVETTTESADNQDTQDPLKLTDDNESTSNQDNDNGLSGKGQFKIRVKSLSELS